MAERTRGTLIVDLMPKECHSYWYPWRKVKRGGEVVETQVYERIEWGARLVEVDLERNPELRGLLALGSARWAEDGESERTTRLSSSKK